MDDKDFLIERNTNKQNSFLLKLILAAVGVLLLVNLLTFIFFFFGNGIVKETCQSDQKSDELEFVLEKSVIISNKTGWKIAAEYLQKGIDFDTDPCDDFFQFVCGKYQNNQLETPDDELSNKATQDLRDAASNFTVDKHSLRVLKQAKLIFDKCMSISDALNVNFSQLAPFIDNLGGWPLVYQNLSDPDWNPYALMGILSSLSIDNIFSVNIMPNWKDHDKGNMIFINQASTLISKKTYMKKGPEAGQWIRQDIEAFAEQMAGFYKISLNEKQLTNDFDIMLLLDYRMAMAEGKSLYEYDNFTELYHEFDLEKAKEKWPDIDWVDYLRGVAADNFDPTKALNKSFNIAMPKFVDILSMLPISAGKGARHAQNYLMYKFISGGYQLLPGYEEQYKKMEKERPKKYWDPWQKDDKFEDISDRADTCFYLLETYLPYVVARLYVEKSFDTLPGKPRDKLRVMTDLVLDGFKDMIKATPWMDEKTKFGAYEKIFNVQKNIAYPEWITDDELLEAKHPESHLNILEEDDPFSMYVKLIRFSNWFKWHKFVEPIDRGYFGEDPPYTVNAWYTSWYNSITIPAAFLHKPYFDVEFPMAVNLGMMGAVMGHELVHGFDNHGSQFDDIGQLITWITKESQRGYNKMTKCLIEQYNGYCYPKYDNICINGSFTLGENIADNGGTGAAYLAYKNFVEKFGTEHRFSGRLSKYTMEQVFYMAFGMSWCLDQTGDPTWQIKGDVRSPAKYRVLGTLHDFPPFAKAFKCKKGSGMVPKKTCKGWWH